MNIKEIKFIFQNFSTRTAPAPADFTDKLYQTFKDQDDTNLIQKLGQSKMEDCQRSSKLPVLEIHSRKHSFTGREAKLHFQIVDCFHQTYHKYNGLKSPHHPSCSKLELGMCQVWVRLISCSSSQTYFRPTHQGYRRSQGAFTEHLIPTTQITFFWVYNSYFIPILQLVPHNFLLSFYSPEDWGYCYTCPKVTLK